MRALVDLLLPASCYGCGRADAVVCATCVRPLHGVAQLRMPSPCPPDMPEAFSVSAYADPVRRLVLAYKERDAVGLRHSLAYALSTAIATAATALSARRPLALVPVPSTAVAVRRRGFDPTLGLAQAAARQLREVGADVVVAPLLVHARVVADSAGLNAGQRQANLRGALKVARGAPRARGQEVSDRAVIVVDDVITTGATIAEATRALRAAGVSPVAAATVAATQRQTELVRPGLHKRRSGDYGAG